MHEVTPASVKSFKRLLAAKLSSVPVFPFTGMDISVDALPGGSGGGSWSFEGDHLALLGLYSEEAYANCSGWDLDYTGTPEEKASAFSEMLLLDVRFAVQDALAEAFPDASCGLYISIRDSILHLALYGAAPGLTLDLPLNPVTRNHA